MSRGYSRSSGFAARERMTAAESSAVKALASLGKRPSGELSQDSYAAMAPLNVGAKFENSKDNPASMLNAELHFRNNVYETGAFFDGNTGKPIIVKADDSPDSVDFTNKQLKALWKVKDGVVFTHNHPQSSSFSTEDFMLAAAGNCREFRIISERYTYSLADRSGAYRKTMFDPKVFDMKKGYSKEDIDEMKYKIRAKTPKAVFDRLSQEAMDNAKKYGSDYDKEHNIVVSDYIVSRLAAKLGLEYRRTPIHNAKP